MTLTRYPLALTRTPENITTRSFWIADTAGELPSGRQFIGDYALILGDSSFYIADTETTWVAISAGGGGGHPNLATHDAMGLATDTELSNAIAAHLSDPDPHTQYALDTDLSAHVAAADPHTGYRLESANHSHQSSGLEGGQLDHGLALTGLSDDDHALYLLASDATNRATFASNWTDLTDGGSTTLHSHAAGATPTLSAVLTAGASAAQIPITEFAAFYGSPGGGLVGVASFYVDVPVPGYITLQSGDDDVFSPANFTLSPGDGEDGRAGIRTDGTNGSSGDVLTAQGDGTAIWGAPAVPTLAAVLTESNDAEGQGIVGITLVQGTLSGPLTVPAYLLFDDDEGQIDFFGGSDGSFGGGRVSILPGVGVDGRVKMFTDGSYGDVGQFLAALGAGGDNASTWRALEASDIPFAEYTDEQAQDAVGGILTDSATIDFTYSDAGNTITAAVIQAALDHGSIGGLTDDDHAQYLLTNGGRALTGNWVQSGVFGIWTAGSLRVGSSSAPTNTTAGDITGTRLLIGTDAAFNHGNKLFVNSAAFAFTADGSVVDITGGKDSSAGVAFNDRLVNLVFDDASASGTQSVWGGLRMVGTHSGAGTLTAFRGISMSMGNSAGTVSGMDMILLAPGTFSGGTTTLYRGLRIQNLGGANRTSTYGLDISAQSGSSLEDIAFRNDGNSLQRGSARYGVLTTGANVTDGDLSVIRFYAGTDAAILSGLTAQVAGVLGISAQNALRLYDSDNSNYIAHRSNASRTTNITYDWPVTDPTVGQILSASAPSAGIVTLSWSSAGAGYTDEQAQDAVGTILTDTSSIDFTYDDAGNTISAVVLPAGVDHNSLANLTTGDPHTQYALDTDLSSHAAAADPHTGYLLESLFDAKGDLIAASADNTPAKVTVGANGTILMADSTAGAGIAWRVRSTTAELANVGATESAGTDTTIPFGDHVHALGIGTTRGDILTWNSTPVAARIAIGSSGKFLRSDGSDPSWQTLATADMPANGLIRTITFIIDGGGATITTGIKGDLEIPFACTINRVTVLADQSGSIVVDIWKDTYANYPPTVADTITASAKPTLSSAAKSQDATLTGWTTAITAGDTLRYNVDSITTCQRVVISLKVTMT